MKKFNNKKGFTIVELVIVIAVIGILAGVLIPTFSGIVQRANESKINQEMTNALKVVLAGNATSGALANGTTFVMGEKDGTNYKATYYAKYNGNKFEKILNVSGNKSSDDDLKTTGYDRVIVGTKKDGSFYDATLKAIANLYNWTDTDANVVKTNDISKIGGANANALTVLTNSDLSDGMFVLVPKDNGSASTTTVTVTVNGTDIFEGGKVEVEVTKGATVVNVTAKDSFTLESGKTIKAGDSGNVAYDAETRKITITVTSAINAETTITLTVE